MWKASLRFFIMFFTLSVSRAMFSIPGVPRTLLAVL